MFVLRGKKGRNEHVHGLKKYLFSQLQENLRYYVDKVFREIVRSSISCPTLMCDVFYSLRHLAAKRFPSKCSLKLLKVEFRLKTSAVTLWGLLKSCLVQSCALNFDSQEFVFLSGCKL